MDFEAVDTGEVSLGALSGDQGGVHLEDDVMERCAEVSSIDSAVSSRLGVVEILASCTVQLDSLDIGIVRLAHWQERVLLAHNARALSKVRLLVLVEL